MPSPEWPTIKDLSQCKPAFDTNTVSVIFTDGLESPFRKARIKNMQTRWARAAGALCHLGRGRGVCRTRCVDVGRQSDVGGRCRPPIQLPPLGADWQPLWSETVEVFGHAWRLPRGHAWRPSSEAQAVVEHPQEPSLSQTSISAHITIKAHMCTPTMLDDHVNGHGS